MADFGKLFVYVGLVLVLIGAVLVAAGRLNVPLGRLPGDFLYRGKNTTFYFPLVTSIVLSVVVSAILMLLGRVKR